LPNGQMSGLPPEAGDLGSGTSSSDDGAGLARRPCRLPLWLGRSAGAQLGSVAEAGDLGDLVFGRWRGAGPEAGPAAAVVGGSGWLVGLGPGLLAHFASASGFGGGMVLFVGVCGIENDISHA
jgi:hypothetical protein